MVVSFDFQACAVRFKWLVMIVLLGSSLVVQGCIVTSDCAAGQVCCTDDCVDGSSCVGHSCGFNQNCAEGESCCESGVCVLGSSCLGRPCTADGTGGRFCTGGESCCNGKCISGSICIGSSCSKDSDCGYRNIEYCCRGTCSYKSGCTNTTVIIVSSICGFVFIVLLISLCIYCRRRVQRERTTIGSTTYGST